MVTELEKALRLKAKLQRGEACLGAQISLSDPAVAEILGRAGYDWLVVDTEHTANGTLTVRAMLQAAANTDALVLARALRLDPDEIRRFIDLGSPGVLCPFINTGEDAQKLVQACRYPPIGTRGYGPRRASGYGFDGAYFRTANDAMVCIPIIESKRAIENIEDIVSVDGIVGVCIGPADLSISLDVFGQIEHPTFLAAVDRVRRACRKYGKAMGAGCYSLDHAKQCVASGDTLLLVGDDDDYLKTEATRWVEILRNPKS